MCFCGIILKILNKRTYSNPGVEGGGGYSIYPWVGRCGSAPHTLTLFKTGYKMLCGFLVA